MYAVHKQSRSVTGVLQINIFWFKKDNLRPAYSGVIRVKAVDQLDAGLRRIKTSQPPNIKYLLKCKKM